MKSNLHTLTLGLFVCGAAFGLTACQTTNDDSVHAAREPVPSKAPPPSVNTINGADREFIIEAEKSNIQERVLGRMAEERAQNTDVKDYGKMMARDHNNALQNLVELMDKYGIAQPKTLPEDRTDAISRLQSLSGDAFDREFISVMVQDHQKAINTFRQKAETAENTDVRDYAKNMLPALERHLQDAQDLQKEIGAS
jgi:putative membrane protein